MFFDTAEQVAEQNQEREGGTDLAELALETVYDPTPGRVSTSSKGELFSGFVKCHCSLLFSLNCIKYVVSARSNSSKYSNNHSNL